MNMEAVLDGKLKCRAARKGESRSEESEGMLLEDRTLETGVDLAPGSETVVASSGCLIITHS